MQSGISHGRNVRLSVCLSVKRVNCDKTKETSAKLLIHYKMLIHLVFSQKEWLAGDDPFYLKVWAKLIPSLQKQLFLIDFRS